MAYSVQGWVNKHIKNDAGTNPFMMRSSNGNIFSVTGPLWGESTRSIYVFFDLRLNKRLNKKYWDASDLRRIYDVTVMI